MTDQELHHLADLCRVIDHMEAHGLYGSPAHARLLTKRDAAIVEAGIPVPDLRSIPAQAGNRKAKR